MWVTVSLIYKKQAQKKDNNKDGHDGSDYKNKIYTEVLNSCISLKEKNCSFFLDPPQEQRIETVLGKQPKSFSFIS